MRRYVYKEGYEEYLKHQVAATQRKRRKQWCTEGDIAFVAQWIVENGWPCEAGLCHGTRSGREQAWFAKHLVANGASPGMVIGSELYVGRRSGYKPLVFNHDFNKVKEDWVGRFGFVYSNSHDHIFDPGETFRVWADQLMAHKRKRGVLILEHSAGHIRINATDPLGGTADQLIECVAGVGLRLVGDVEHQAPDNLRHKKRYLAFMDGTK